MQKITKEQNSDFSVQVSISLPLSFVKEIDIITAEERISRAKFIKEAVRRYLDTFKKS